MKKFIIFYYLDSDYDYVYVNAKSLSHATSAADSFSRKSGAVIVGICPEFLLNSWNHE